MMVPRKTMEEELKGQEKELSDDISNLHKKVGDVLQASPLHRPQCFLVEIPGKTVQRRAISTSGHCAPPHTFL